MTQATTTPTDMVDRWLAIYGAPDANAAALLVDGHDPDAVTFTVIEVEASADADSAPVPVTTDVTYGDLAERSKRFASALADLGVGRGDTVGVLMGKREELVVSLLAIARLGAVYIPLFTAFATPAIEMRLRAGNAKVVITEPSQASKLDGLEDIRTVVAGPEFEELVDSHDPIAESVAVGGEGTLILLFTSGTTGAPKGVPVPVKALASFVA
ncbi:putative fatty-acid--CoA ligase [Gordonia amicalis NBRC 100051 = JCM 11271]|nr:putative fatty-acid--CoA ligase [Gordonia amicalis NBRC 100051 = JCM 11271]